jgi:hypothetical protein
MVQLPEVSYKALEVNALTCISRTTFWTAEMLCKLVHNKALLLRKLFVTPITEQFGTASTRILRTFLASTHC